jgi:hypothetical protein
LWASLGNHRPCPWGSISGSALNLSQLARLLSQTGISVDLCHGKRDACLLKEMVDLETMIVIIIEGYGKIQIPPIRKEFNEKILEIGIRFFPE